MDRRRFLQAFTRTAVQSVVAAPIAAGLARPMVAPDAPVTERAYDRVMRTGTLRCGYGIWAPGLIKDPVTGQLSGIFYDYLNAIGAHTGIKIEWTEEIPWGDFSAALNSGRIDAMCFGAWPKAIIAKDVLFTKSTYYLPISAYVRAGDTRFDGKLDSIDNAGVKISTMDAELSSQLAAAQFPKAATLSIPQSSDASVLLLNVTTGKADITFTDAYTAAKFMQQNPGQLREVGGIAPLRLFGHTIPVGRGEHSLVAVLNTATDEIISSGELERIVKKYTATLPGVLLLDKPEYQ